MGVPSSTSKFSRPPVTAPAVGAVMVVVMVILTAVGFYVFGGQCNGGYTVMFFGLAVLAAGGAAVFFGGPKALFAAGGVATVLIIYGLILVASAPGCAL